MINLHESMGPGPGLNSRPLSLQSDTLLTALHSLVGQLSMKKFDNLGARLCILLIKINEFFVPHKCLSLP